MEEPGEDIQVENSAGKDSLEEQDVATDGEDGDEISSAVEKGLGRLRKGSQVQAAMLTNVARGVKSKDDWRVGINNTQRALVVLYVVSVRMKQVKKPSTKMDVLA